MSQIKFAYYCESSRSIVLWTTNNITSILLMRCLVSRDLEIYRVNYKNFCIHNNRLHFDWIKRQWHTTKLKVSVIAGCSIVVRRSIRKRQFQDILDRSEPAKLTHSHACIYQPTSPRPTTSTHTESISQGYCWKWHHKLFDKYICMLWHLKLHDVLYRH